MLIAQRKLRCISPKINFKAFTMRHYIVGWICDNFEKNRAFYDKSMKLGTWLVDNNTNKLRVSATSKMSSNGCHLVFFQNGRLLQLIHYNVIFDLQT